MEWLALIGSVTTLLIGLPILWKTVIQPAAKKIAEGSVTGPILAELAKTHPPVTEQLAAIKRELSDINMRLTHLENR